MLDRQCMLACQRLDLTYTPRIAQGADYVSPQKMQVRKEQ